MEPTFFHKVLVANRGEIARRIFRTLKEMGIATVAVYSDADRDAAFVREAGEAVRLGPAPSAESYLNQEAVIAAALTTRADAVHPGYGFLAENARFAERCAEAELVFIGPSPEAIRRMGHKTEAKALAAEAGVPILDGFAVDGLEEDAVCERAERLGYPLMIKAAAGGGGKGMRVVASAAGLRTALAAAGREAVAAFGDGALLVERFLASSRHVEIQILGDAHGRLVHVFERDCSVQRRHQKVFEESPSPVVDEKLRERMGEAAVALARAVAYRGAGTVEFLLDPGGAFFFLEMNTRLQVEHPVTEAVTGLDLVRLQVEVAQGLPLGFEQDDLALEGHAIEARLYAEDPAKDFLPTGGTVALWSLPELPGLRIDSGVRAGDEVGVHYDPMLAKVIAHGRNRDEALRRLHRGLSELAVGGPVTNRDFLLAVLEDEAFRRGEADTAFLERRPAPGSRVRACDPEVLELHAIAAALHLFARRRARPSPVPPAVPAGWRNNRWRPQEQSFEHAVGRLAVRYVVRCDGGFDIDVSVPGVSGEAPEERATESLKRSARLVEIGDRGLVFEGLVAEGLVFEGLVAEGLVAEGLTAEGLVAEGLVAEVDGVRRRFRIGELRNAVRGGSDRRLWVHALGQVSELAAVPRFPQRGPASVAGGCVAPMTGKVVQVRVSEGDPVSAGDPLLVLEAMKMEHQLTAHADGVVESVRVEPGQMVDPDDILVVVAPRGSAEKS